MRLKFGSAPAQLLTIGKEAEKSLEKRASAIKRQFQINNDVSTKSQLSQNISKQATHGGTISSASWLKKDDPSIVTIETLRDNSIKKTNQSGFKNNKKYPSSSEKKAYFNEKTDDDSDDDQDLIVTNRKNTGKSQNSTGRLSNLAPPY